MIEKKPLVIDCCCYCWGKEGRRRGTH